MGPDEQHSEEIELRSFDNGRNERDAGEDGSNTDEELHLLRDPSTPRSHIPDQPGLLLSPQRTWVRRNLPTCALMLMVVGAFLASVIAIAVSWNEGTVEATDYTNKDAALNTVLRLKSHERTKIAFGSCTAYDATYQVIWEKGVIPSAPDTWIWLGDMAYLDTQTVNCKHAVSYPPCNCSADWLHTPPFSCAAGDLRHALRKWQLMLLQEGYQRFLEYMCPGHSSHSMPPPPGSDTDICPRPVLGIYDDHDFGWNNGNRRLPDKGAYKSMYLDALGEPADSPRRNIHNGAQWTYTLQAGNKGDSVDVVLLDERYDRTTLPCEVRDMWCRQVIAEGPTSSPGSYAWCKDFLQDPQPSGKLGSCCKADQEVYYGWCTQPTNANSSYYSMLCDPSHESYGRESYVIKNGSVARPDPGDPRDWDEDAPLCDVLGPRQRKWLQQQLTHSKARVKVIVSGSVLLGRPLDVNTEDNPRQQCSGDDWDCYRPAQLNLLSTLLRYSRANGGCWVVLVGDYHMSDIKVAMPGEDRSYAQTYGTANLSTPIYQVMASGMTNSTASPNQPCAGWRVDSAGLRPLGPCAFVDLPAFGMLDIDWLSRRLLLQIRTAHDGEVVQQISVNLDTCLPE